MSSAELNLIIRPMQEKARNGSLLHLCEGKREKKKNKVCRLPKNKVPLEGHSLNKPLNYQNLK